MKRLGMILAVTFCLAGCAKEPPPPSYGDTAVTDSRSLPHISETNRLRLGMHESEVYQILGPPARRESGYNNGYRLWYELYDPRNASVPSNYLISTDRNGYVTFISSGGASTGSRCCPCP